ncbi:MAG: hypothetical protein GY697_02470 [Desulfobacterales bacterium]|nr:hypothetical protein [Desulfobacterales bacterium]
MYVDTEEEARKIQGLPVDGIVTDHLDRVYDVFSYALHETSTHGSGSGEKVGVQS